MEWAKGVPTPIRQICPSERIENPEWLFLWCIEDQKGDRYPVMGVKYDFTFWCAKNEMTFDLKKLEASIYDLSIALSSTKEELKQTLTNSINRVNRKIEETKCAGRTYIFA